MTRSPLTGGAFERRMGGAGAIRRKGRMASRGSRVDPRLFGATNISAGSFYQTGSPGGVAGSTSFWVAWLFQVTSQATSATRHITNRFLGTPLGWAARTENTNATLRFYVTNGVGSFTGSPAYTIPAGEVGKAHLGVGVYATDTVRLYTKRVEVGSGTATGGGFQAASSNHTLGSRVGGASPSDNMILFGASGGAGTPSLAQVQALFDSVKAIYDIDGIPGMTDHLWSVKRDYAGSLPSTLTNRAGSGNMTSTGAGMTINIISTPTWAW